MNGFKLFIEQSKEQKENIKKTLEKVPESHRSLFKNYKIKWHGDNILPGDRDHVGLVDNNKKIITIAGSYNYGREHVFLHELAHLVWAKFMLPNKELVEKWKKLVNSTKEKPNQNAEELWCHSYATYYSKNAVDKFNFPTWMQFIKETPK